MTLTNIMPILAINLKDASSGRSITSGLNQVVISLFFPATPDNKATYTVAPTSGTFGTDVIYVAVHEKYGANVEITATDGNDEYTKTLTNKDYRAGNFYNIGWLMTHTPKTYNLSAATGNITLKDGDTATGELNGNYKVSIADGATVTLDGVTINGVDYIDYKWAGITCQGNATIILSGTNTVKGFYNNYPGIQAGPEGTTLTIDGTGTLEASSGDNGPGIGCRSNSSCGNITIAPTVSKVTATKGSGASNSIGASYNSTCGMVTIGGTVYWDGSDYQNDGEPILTQNKFVYPIESLDVAGVTIKYSVGETWRQAITDHSTLNTGWSIDNNYVKYTSYRTLYTKVNYLDQYVKPDEVICSGPYKWVEKNY